MDRKILVSVGIIVAIITLFGLNTIHTDTDKPTATTEETQVTKPPLTIPKTSYVKVVEGYPKLFIGDKESEITGFYIVDPRSEKYIDKAARYNFTFVIYPLEWAFIENATTQFLKENPELAEEITELINEGEVGEAIGLLPEMKAPENAVDLINFAKLDEVFDYSASKGVYVVPSFWCQGNRVPIWWAKNYDEQLQEDSEGRLAWMPSFNSPALERYADEIITVMVQRYKNHPALLGWNLPFGWTQENNYPGGPTPCYGSVGWYDYSEFATQRFRDWLRARYNNDLSSLQEAWGNSTVTFEDAEIPKPLPEISGSEEIEEWENGAGDARREWYDWQLFRFEEKKISRDHFAKLYKTLDTNHVLFTTAAAPLISGAHPQPAYRASTDYYEFACSPYIDIVFFHPGVTNEIWSNPVFVTSFYNFVKYYETRGKAVFIKWENYDCDNLEAVKKCARFARGTGTGIVLCEGKFRFPSGDRMVDEFSEEEIKAVAETFHSTPEGKLEKSGFAIIEDPLLAAFDYQLGSKYKGETLGLGILLVNEGLDFDVLTTDEIRRNPEVLKDYKVVAAVNLARMDEEILNALLKFREGGGGLFIVGRTGLFDKYGDKNTTYLKMLLDVDNLQEHKITQYGWSFTKGDPLLKGIEGKKIGKKNENLLYIPVFDYKKEGYRVLGYFDDNPKVATVGYKGKTVFYFSEIGIKEKKAEIQEFLENLYDFYDIHSEIHLEIERMIE